jgi:hypothetical protein
MLKRLLDSMMLFHLAEVAFYCAGIAAAWKVAGRIERVLPGSKHRGRPEPVLKWVSGAAAGLLVVSGWTVYLTRAMLFTWLAYYILALAFCTAVFLCLFVFGRMFQP